jgi:hypothetical protein
MMKMTEKFRKYCEFEFHHALTAKNLGLVDKDFTWYAVQRILGAGTFAQMLNGSYKEIEEIFEEYKEKILKIS